MTRAEILAEVGRIADVMDTALDEEDRDRQYIVEDAIGDLRKLLERAA